jgi:hypothetical protein
VLGLFLAVLRTLRGPVFFPVRVLARRTPTSSAGCRW